MRCISYSSVSLLHFRLTRSWTWTFFMPTIRTRTQIAVTTPFVNRSLWVLTRKVETTGTTSLGFVTKTLSIFAFSLRPPARLHSLGDVTLRATSGLPKPIVHTRRARTTPVEFHIAGAAQARSLYETENGSSASSLLPEFQFSIHSITESYARASATNAIHAYVGLTVH